MAKELKITTVSYATFTDIEFIPPASWYITDALQNYHFIHTSRREVAQEWADSHYGKGKYKVKASKINRKSPKPAEEYV